MEERSKDRTYVVKNGEVYVQTIQDNQSRLRDEERLDFRQTSKRVTEAFAQKGPR